MYMLMFFHVNEMTAFCFTRLVRCFDLGLPLVPSVFLFSIPGVFLLFVDFLSLSRHDFVFPGEHLGADLPDVLYTGDDQHGAVHNHSTLITIQVLHLPCLLCTHCTIAQGFFKCIVA